MDFDTAKKYLIDLLKIKSVETESSLGAPFGKGVRECLDYALTILEGEGFSVKNGDGFYGYGEVGEGELFGILCHLDVVPEGKGWSYPPFGAVEENNKIYARGALDDKSPFIAVLLAIKRLLQQGYTPKKRIRIILGCDEESGWKCMDAYMENEEMPVCGFSPDGDFPVINCEKGIVYHSISYPKPVFLDYVKSGERANMVPDYAEARLLLSDEIKGKIKDADESVTIKTDGESVIISAIGKAAHGSHPEEGENALLKLLKVLAVIYQPFKEIYNAFFDSDGSGIGLDLKDEKSGKLTLNLGTAKTEGDSVVFELDIRHPISVTKEKITEILKDNLDGRIEETFYHLPLYVDKDHLLIRELLSAYNKVMKTHAEPICIGGGTYARVLPLGVAFGPCFPNSKAGIHCADEYVDLDEFKNSVKIYEEALKKLCFDV